jgi:hypothetical protein
VQEPTTSRQQTRLEKEKETVQKNRASTPPPQKPIEKPMQEPSRGRTRQQTRLEKEAVQKKGRSDKPHNTQETEQPTLTRMTRHQTRLQAEAKSDQTKEEARKGIGGPKKKKK